MKSLFFERLWTIIHCMKINIIKLRIILWHFLAVVVVFFIYMAIVPSGHIAYTYDFEKDNFFISKLGPNDRLGELNSGFQKVIGDPVYFSLFTPRVFNEAKLSIKYKNNNPELNSIIEAGILVDNTIWRHKLYPIENSIIDTFSENWHLIEDDEVSLFIDTSRASSSYSSVSDFLINPPALEEIATYNYDLNIDYSMKEYASSTVGYSIDTKLRGPYQFFTYIDNEDLFFEFTFSDLNKNKDSDEIYLHLYYQDQLIDSRFLEDDGIKDDNAEILDSRSLSFELLNMPSGVYKIELRATDDIISEKIETKQNKISFLNKIWISDFGENDLSVFTDSSMVHFQTINPASLQNILFATSSLALNETYRQFSQELEGSSTEIIFEKDDIILAGNGVFSFDGNSLFNPRVKKIDSNFKLDQSGVKYILANYRKPEKDDEYFRKELNFDLRGAYRENSKYNFLISIPGLKADDDINDTIEISEIKIDLYGVDLITKLKSLLK